MTAGRTTINRMAMAIAHEKGRQWNRMTPARQEQLRRQARAALLAFQPGAVITAREDGQIADAVCEAHRCGDPRAAEALVAAWVDEVLA